MTEEQTNPTAEEAATPESAPETTPEPEAPSPEAASVEASAEEASPEEPVAQAEAEEAGEPEVEEAAIPPAMDLPAEEPEAEAEAPTVESPGAFLDSLRGRRPRPRSRVGQVRLEDIDYKNVKTLSLFIDDRGRILSRRKTRISAKMQRRVTRAIKRARHLALLPYTAEHIRMARKRSGGS